MHVPVLKKQVLEYLDPKPGENFIDCTIGEGGHAFSILEKTKEGGKLLGIDWDEQVIESLKIKIRDSNLKKRLVLVNDSFVNLKEIASRNKFKPVQGILFDLGVSSRHLEESGRGFSFLKEEPLDMRFSGNQQLTAKEIINRFSKDKIEEILSNYGEERFAKRIAEKIVGARRYKPIETTRELVEIIRTATPYWYHRQRINFSTRTFQALRIAVNDELNSLKEALGQALAVLDASGRLAVISFHSLEDRIAKNFFKLNSQKKTIRVLTKKPIKPEEEETKANPRSRSAKLRVAIKI